ncbi:hypothetical protein Taro_000698 [Colocasia esculenta]|uniref:Retrotransposon gag domain-containing protein n=1 Tax=Colocasia esculenta TaxID=4460 RepID=A0A843TFX9_COLES|nr:hypothetical protein [Colocasia esculenta]
MCVLVVVAIVRPVWFGRVVCAGVDGQVWSLTDLTSIEGDANLKNLTLGLVDVYCDDSLNGIRVDANLCDLQNIGLPEDSFLTLFSLSLALFSRPLIPHYFQQLQKVRARRAFLDRHPIQSRVVAVQGQYRQQCNCGVISLARLRPVRGRRTQIKYVIGLTGLDEVFRHSWFQSKKFEMADRRDWGGGGDDPEESTQHMIERIWESLTDIRRRMDQQASVPPIAVPPGDGETVPTVPVPPSPGVEVPFIARLPPPPMLVAEEPVMQVEKFLRLQPPTYSGGPNPDTVEHWVHEIERVFATMRCPATDKAVLAAYQLRGFVLEWWRLKMQTTFVGRTEEAITWSKFLDVFNDTFFPIQVQQVKREQFLTLQQVMAM